MKKYSWPLAIALAYGLFAVLTIGFVVFAVRNPTDLVSRDYYRDEIRHQERMDSEQRAQNDPDAPTVAMNKAARTCVIHFPGTAPASGTLTLYRPSDAKLDRTVAVSLDGKQSQTLDLADSVPGLWRLRIEWTRSNETYFSEEVLVL